MGNLPSQNLVPEKNIQSNLSQQRNMRDVWTVGGQETVFHRIPPP
jgi:hypothetical protein